MFKLLLQTVCNGSCSWLIQKLHNIKTCNGACIQCCLALPVIETSWDCNNGMFHRLTQVTPCILFQFPQENCRSFFWAHGFRCSTHIHLHEHAFL
mmetsp:Transcript_11641/g.20618  ORF Transcript_11641/g.20618 Transcript_11641/m.20618 type:complete len:95 (-) Transcript_11641:276-560(-)